MVKPDGVQRGLVGKILQRIEEKGFKIVAMKMVIISMDRAKEHYAEHTAKPFFNELLEYITSGPVVQMVIEGKGSIESIRRINGPTNPSEAAPGTIRGDLAIERGKNVIHGSDSPTSATREIAIHFSESEIVGYQRVDEVWLYD